MNRACCGLSVLVFCAPLACMVFSCTADFPICKTDEDCTSEAGNSSLMHCCKGQCQECCLDDDCRGQRTRCRDFRCVEGDVISKAKTEAEQLVERIDSLSDAEKKRLEELGVKAFGALYGLVRQLIPECEGKQRTPYSYGCRGKDLARFNNAMKSLTKVATRQHTQDMISLLHESRSCLTKHDLILWLHKKTDEKLYLRIFLEILQEDKSGPYNRPCFEGFLFEVLQSSSNRIAVEFLIGQLKNPKAKPEYRNVAFSSLASTGGEKGLNAVLAAKDRQRKTKVIKHAGIDEMGTEVMDRPEKHYHKLYLHYYEAKLLDKREDKDGVLWGLISSMALGSFKDLWISRHDGKQWSEPLFTGTKLDELGSKDWFKTFVGNPDVSKDSDRDSLTDLVEQRLGTNLKKPDTDGDGINDSIDKNPLAAPRKLSDYERILAAAFEARYRFVGWRDVPILVDLPKGVEPMEFMGWDRFIIACRHGEKHPMEKAVGEGIASAIFGTRTFLDDNPEEQGWIKEGYRIYWNKDRTEARLSVSTYYGRTDATRFHIHLRKFRETWIVISCKIVSVS